MIKKIYLILLMIMVLVTTVHGLKEVDGDRREPTVTQEEAGFINQALTISQKDLQKAIAYLKPVIKPASSAALDFALANFYFQYKKSAEAINYYKQALQKMPAFDRARANLARLYIQQDLPDKAFKELKVILADGTEKASILTLVGYIYLLNEQAIPAESAYRKALLSEPNDEQAYMGLAKALLMQQRYQEASRLFAELLMQHPKKKDAWIHLANTQLVMGQSEKAIVSLESARRLGILRTNGLATLGDLYLNQGQAKDALECYKEAFNNKYNSIARLLRAVEGFLMIGEVHYAAQLIKDAEKIDKQAPIEQIHKSKLLWLTARLAHLAGHHHKALKHYHALLEKDPLNGKVLMALGEIYQLLAQYEKAGIQFERAARIDSVQVDALIKHAQLEVKREHYQKAIALLEHAQLLEATPRLNRYLKQVRYLNR